jgi:hypothetical protein
VLLETLILLQVHPFFLISAYPETEAHDQNQTLMGAALQNGYQSHYVVTNRAGSTLNPPKPQGHSCLGIASDSDWSGTDTAFDEVVIGQEAQIAPLYIIEVERDNLQDVGRVWDKMGELRRDKFGSKGVNTTATIN